MDIEGGVDLRVVDIRVGRLYMGWIANMSRTEWEPGEDEMGEQESSC